MSPGGETPYTEEFYKRHCEGSLRSAQATVPVVLRLVQPRSVVDVGCGIGAWLSVFREHGIADIHGMDGDWVNRAALMIPPERFSPIDLQRPFRIDRQFDLAMSLEVAEHLPAESARGFVESLTKLAPLVLFSAAIPFQRGTNHVNTQWPSYWAEHFAGHGYAVIDCIRRQVWDNPDVEWPYAQNALMFARQEAIERSTVLQEELARTASAQLALVHPRRYLEEIAEWRRLLLTTQEIAALIPQRDSFILVDHDIVRVELAFGRRAIPFLECDGENWGLPGDDVTAIREFERLHHAGARFIVFAWPAFWWLEYYSGFHEYLRSRFPCVLTSERLVAFDLRR